MASAQYYALLARAVPGAGWWEMRWEISLAMGWGLIHARGILEGQTFVWPDPELSEAGRTLRRAGALAREILAKGVPGLEDL